MPTVIVDAFLFEIDGTLIDSTPGVLNAWRKFGKEYWFDPDAAISGMYAPEVLKFKGLE
ncbi:hypothetical protein M422DRAFT_258867 [Sphaerobolus stellatus SS14]|uniref:Uncharacterized protein n=1 Tax=Sphaerobolus stellatus (strain SS14) TaxID=990650 RepID=A0A0C9VAB8_SPHS4|nr:hypothetical protein M422DRAFT_258867 [Sphaerobolus stellatus SS14]